MRIRYDPLTGTFSRNGKPLPVQLHASGTPLIAIGRCKYGMLRTPAARLAWALHTGTPAPDTHYVINRDGDKLNLRFDNLACVPKSFVRRNGRTPANNSSGLRNVSWVPRLGKWVVRLRLDGRSRSFGYFSDLEEAKATAAAVRLEHCTLTS